MEIEGLDAEDWLVMDMGNIVLHLFQPEARASWDLETLWTVGKNRMKAGGGCRVPGEFRMCSYLFISGPEIIYDGNC